MIEIYENQEIWFEARGLKNPILSDLGLVVPGKAAIWLYATNSPILYLDNLVTNPGIRPREAYDAIRLLHAGVVDLAKRMCYDYVVAVTPAASVEKFFRRLGAVEIGPGRLALEV